jgi:hypothetical protein
MRRRLLQAAVAACLLLGTGIGGWIALDATRSTASAEVVDHLIDWNLELAQAPSAAERSRIYADRAEPLRQAVQKAKLPGEERELAERLLANGSWLADHDDLMTEADRFTDVADQLLLRIDAASRRGNDKELRRLTHLYTRVTQQGIGAKLEKLQSLGVLNAEHERRLERLMLRDTHRRQKLEAVLERSPEASRKEIKKALDLPRHAQKRKETGTASPD